MLNSKPRVLVLGSSGLTGKAIAAKLDDASDRVEVVRASRDPETIEQWRNQGRSAVHLDLDDARTFPTALEGIRPVVRHDGLHRRHDAPDEDHHRRRS